MLKWCIVGSGDVVNRLVDKSLNIKNKSKVVSILSDDENQAKKLAKKIDAEIYYKTTQKNLYKILNNKNINSIYIATPPKFHFKYINFFCKQKKNIICEKPLVVKLDELEKLKKLKKKYNFNLLTCFYRRYLDRFLYIKKLLKKKIIGKIVYFNIRYFHNDKNHPTAKLTGKKIPWRFQKKISGGGNIVDMGIHSIDLISFLIDEIQNVTGFNNNYKKIYDVEDSTIVNFKLKNGTLGQGSWCSVAPKKKDFFEIYGTKGFIKFSQNFSEDENLYINTSNKEKKIKLKYNLPLHKNMMKKFVNILNYNNKKGLYTFTNNGIKTVEILNKIIKL
tara:strand:+ start:116 stop:1114 length:999 start_codon:yes stop_codon:yes gene_type:complete